MERLQIYNGFMQRPLSNGPNCPFWCNGCVTTVAAGQRQRADTWYPTSILRPAHRHTAMSTARSGVRGTKRSERPATVACYTVLCYARLYMVMAPPPISTQLTAYTYMAGLDMINKKSALPPGVHGTFFRPPIGPFRGGMAPEPAARAIFGNFWAL